MEVMSKHENDNMFMLDSGFPDLPVGFPVGGVSSSSSTGTTAEVFLGDTSRTDAEISLFKRKWLRDHKKYNVVSNNCRHYAFALAAFLNTPATNTPWVVSTMVSGVFSSEKEGKA